MVERDEVDPNYYIQIPYQKNKPVSRFLIDEGLPELKINGKEFVSWLRKIPEPERQKHSPEFLATLFVVRKVLELLYE